MPPSHAIVADECVHRGIIAALRDAGHAVVAVVETCSGSEDQDVLAMAVKSRAILVTNDRDYGELVFRGHSSPPACILYLRERTAPWPDTAARLIEVLSGPIEGQFIVIDDDVRRRPFESKV